MMMRSAGGIGAAALSLAAPALGAPSVEIKDAAARVIVVPEARSDVKVQLLAANPALPLTIRTFGDRVIVDGGLRRRLGGCSNLFGRTVIHIRDLGEVSYDSLPQVVVHAPQDVRVGASGAVFGRIGRSGSVELSNAGCGDWLIANVQGTLRINDAGSGDVRAGRAGALAARVAGSGDVATREISGPATIDMAGSGDVSAASISGDLHASVAGSGDVKIRDGHAPDMQVRIAGSGDVTFDGTADEVNAVIAGSGDVNVARVTGPIHKSVFGSGDVNVGH